MKIAAVIAEYNPFHRGHQFHIEQTRRETGADYILAVMSGDFVQRGVPAFCNKYLRAQMALLGGADAVIELPALYACASAEYFAGGAVTLLNQLGCIDLLSFGSEAGELAPLKACADLLTDPEASFQASLSDGLKNGRSYPSAMDKAIAAHSPEMQKLLKTPNNLLAAEYLKALTVTDSPIIPFTLKRTGSSYHDKALSDTENGYASAAAVRHTLAAGYNPEALQGCLPESVFAFMQKNRLLGRPVSEDDFSSLLHYKLILGAKSGFASYLDCTPDLSDKILKHLPDFTSFSGFCSLLKSRDLTYARISRVLLHILLDLETPETFRREFAVRRLFVPYARLLGFRKDAAPLLSALKKNSEIPLISKPAKASSLLDEEAYRLFLTDVRCSEIYETVSPAVCKRTPVNEWKQSPFQLTT